MHVLFVEPAFPKNQREFVRALHAIGAAVTAIGEAPAESLPQEVKQQIVGYERVPSVVDTEAMLAAVRRVQARAWVDRLECTVEAHVEACAAVREETGIPGTTPRTAFLCRDKPAMKDVLREADVPCAQSLGSGDAEEIKAWAEDVGFPLIVKPRSGAGASGTVRVDDMLALNQALAEAGVGHGASVALEEFIEGHEAFYDTLCADGRVVHDFVSHYYPGVLEAMRTRWISPQILTTNRVESAEEYAQVRELGATVNAALGIETSATHMEWFFGPKGLKFSEIGCRPPGVCVWDIYGAANDVDLYVEWAKAVTGREDFDKLSRRYAAGMIALRPDQDGRIRGYEGLGLLERLSDWVIDAHFPPEGTPTQGVEAGYMANAWVRMKHPDYDELRSLLDTVGETIKVRAG